MTPLWMMPGSPEWNRALAAVGAYAATYRVEPRPVFDWVMDNPPGFDSNGEQQPE